MINVLCIIYSFVLNGVRGARKSIKSPILDYAKEKIGKASQAKFVLSPDTVLNQVTNSNLGSLFTKTSLICIFTPLHQKNSIFNRRMWLTNQKRLIVAQSKPHSFRCLSRKNHLRLPHKGPSVLTRYLRSPDVLQHLHSNWTCLECGERWPNRKD